MLIANSVKSGSAHSVIKHLPLLDPVSDNSRALTLVSRLLFSMYWSQPRCLQGHTTVLLSECFPDVQSV